MRVRPKFVLACSSTALADSTAYPFDQNSGRNAKPTSTLCRVSRFTRPHMPMSVCRLLQLHAIQAKSKCFVTPDRSLQHVVTRIVERPDAFVADELEERRLVQEPEYEFSIVEGEPAQNQARRFDYDHTSVSRAAECNPPARVRRRRLLPGGRAGCSDRWHRHSHVVRREVCGDVILQTNCRDARRRRFAMQRTGA